MHEKKIEGSLLKCPNCGHVFEPDEEDEDFKNKIKMFYPGVQLKEKK